MDYLHTPSSEWYSEERVFLKDLCNNDEDPGVSIAEARVEPGVTTAWHSLAGTIERYIITDGAGVAEVGDSKPASVKPGDVVTIPPGVRQRISNTGEGDLKFLCVCTPKYDRKNYKNLESEPIAPS